MHELSVCQASISAAEAVACQHGARKVARVRLMVGPLSGVEPALLQRAFPVAAGDTLLAGATLAIDIAPLRIECTACGACSDAQPNQLVCSACGDWHTRLLSGEELILVSVELLVDTPEAEHV